MTVLALAMVMSGAQVYVSGFYNNGSQVYDFSNPEIVANDGDGVGYMANNSGEFYHFGPATATLTVNGLYNAYNPAVPGFAATPKTGMMHLFSLQAVVSMRVR